VPDDQLSMSARILDKEPIRIIAARDHSRQVASGDWSGHAGFVVRRDAAHRIDGDPKLMEQCGIGMVAGHGKYRVGR